MFKIEQQKQQLRDEAAIANASNIENSYEIEEVDRINSTNYASIKDLDTDRQASVKNLNSIREQQKGLMSDRAYAQYSNWSKSNEARRLSNLKGTYYKKEVDLGTSTATVSLGRAYQTLYNPKATVDQRALAEDNIEKMKAGYSSYFPPFMLESTALTAEYQAIIDNGGTKEMAQQAINRSSDDGRITPEQKKKLYGNITDYYSNVSKKTTQAKAVQTANTYTDFAQKLPTGDLTALDIQSAGFDKATEEKWLGKVDIDGKTVEGYLSAATKNKPQSITPTGFSNTVDTVVGFGTKQFTKQEAYDKILTERYVNNTITDNEMTWAINKIENPYPPDFAQELAGVTDNNKQKIVGNWFVNNKEDNDKLMNVNRQLVSYIEGQFKNNKRPTLDEMYSKSIDFNVNYKPNNQNNIPTASELRQKAQSTDDAQKKQQIYNMGLELGYWK